MKQIFTFLFLLGLTLNINGQQAPDFTVTDIDGNEHNLYSYLDNGKVVILDVSATWCSKCWNFHVGKFLEDITEKYGPEGTDQVQVLFYEGDKNTGQTALEGGAGSQGNWIEGTNYPIINEDPITIDMSVYNDGFPTVSVIRPEDKEIVGDLYTNFLNGTGLAGMEEIIQGAFPSTTSTKALEEVNVVVYPNPFTEVISVDFSNSTIDFSSLQILNSVGQVIEVISATESDVVTIDASRYVNGTYVINIFNENDLVGYKLVTK